MWELKPSEAGNSQRSQRVKRTNFIWSDHPPPPAIDSLDKGQPEVFHTAPSTCSREKMVSGNREEV